MTVRALTMVIIGFLYPAWASGTCPTSEEEVRASGDGGPQRRMPLRPAVATGLPIRPGAPDETRCPLFVEGDMVDIRCGGPAAEAIRSVATSWYAPGVSGLLVWVSGGKPIAVLVPPTVHWSELTVTVSPMQAEAAVLRRCGVRLIVGADGAPVAARANSQCPTIADAERVAMTARFDTPCTEGGAWPVQTDVTIPVP